MTFQSKYLGMSPFNCPSLFSILSFLEYEYGVFHPLGGCGAVSQAMAQAAEDLGAKISLDDEVEEILFQGRRAVGVRSRSGIHQADALVINADFARAMTRLVPDHLRRRWSESQHRQRKKFSCSTFMLYLGIEGRCDDLAHHTIYLASDYLRICRTSSRATCFREIRLSMFKTPASPTRRWLPPARAPFMCLLPVTHQHPNVDWTSEAPRFRELALAQLAKVGLERRRVADRLRADDHACRLGSATSDSSGATFNLAHSLSQMLHLRPRNRFEDLESVYLVGAERTPAAACQ